MSESAPSAESAYIHDLFREIRFIAAEARQRRLLEPTPANCVYEGAVLNVLMMMQSMAGSFDLDRAALGMADFDPVTDELDPRVVKSR